MTSSRDEAGDLLVLSQAEVVSLLDLDALLDALAEAFKEVSAGRTSVPPRVAARTKDGLLGVMPGYLPGAGLESKLVAVFPSNHQRGLPTHLALIALFDEVTGRPLAVMDGTHITAMRTAATSALATRLLARDDARVLAIIGSGVQGAAHLEAVPRVRAFHEVRVASRNQAHAEALASTFAQARPMCDFEQAVRGADVICCCTDAAEPVIAYDWLRPGAHVNSVGANQVGPELDAGTVRNGKLFVESRIAFAAPPAGAAELVGLRPEIATELGEALSGASPGRTSPEDLTVYKSMGHAVEDAAAARLVYDAALREGVGTRVAI